MEGRIPGNPGVAGHRSEPSRSGGGQGMIDELSGAGLVFPKYGPRSYEELDEQCRRETGRSLYEFCNEGGALDGIVADEGAFRAAVAGAVSRFEVGDIAGKTALFNAYAEESSFRRSEGGALAMTEFSGMNAPHAVVCEMFNELFSGVTFDGGGRPHGRGVLRVDLGSDGNTVEVTLDFDKRTIDPPLVVTSAFGRERPVNFSEVMGFLDIYTTDQAGRGPILVRDGERFVVNPAAANGSAMNIFLASSSASVLRHEITHALYDNVPEYRRMVQDRVRAASVEQRECAVLFAACTYDVFDPDAPRVTPDIVIDEAYNAYQNQGAYDPVTTRGHAAFSIAAFCQQYGIALTLEGYSEIADLPLRISAQITFPIC